MNSLDIPVRAHLLRFIVKYRSIQAYMGRVILTGTACRISPTPNQRQPTTTNTLRHPVARKLSIFLVSLIHYTASTLKTSCGTHAHNSRLLMERSQVVAHSSHKSALSESLPLTYYSIRRHYEMMTLTLLSLYLNDRGPRRTIANEGECQINRATFHGNFPSRVPSLMALRLLEFVFWLLP
jgi:hypothetical protein